MRNRCFTKRLDNYLKSILKSSDDENYFNKHKQRYAETLSFIPKVAKNIRVLDVGSGFGHLAILIKKIFGYEVYALDHYNLWEERFHRHGIKFDLCELTGDALPFEIWCSIYGVYRSLTVCSS